MRISPSGRFIPQAHVAGKVMDGELVAINLSTGVYYSSVGAGPAIWQLMEAGMSCSQIADRLSHLAGHPREQIEADVAGFLEKLLDFDLIVESTAESSGEVVELNYAGPYEAPSLTAHTDMEQAFALDPPLRA